MIFGEMLWVMLGGISVGLIGAWALGRTVQSLVYEVQLHEVLKYAAVPLALVAPVMLATIISARRALRVNPAESRAWIERRSDSPQVRFRVNDSQTGMP